ncbi:MAG: methionyl-tRNA formyltransferase [Candidatus Eremiobacteraeota bacterium]|nr:methionyl-tRNA formyltransferase [Candidatus Eremiobacteraeota bacterium]
MRTLFFGTSEFAVPSLRVVGKHSDLTATVTQPDRPAGRGQRLTPSPVKRAAIELGVPVYEPARLRDFAKDVTGAGFDFFILASYGRILPKELLAVPRRGTLNVHPSLLPKYRGATPMQAALRNGDSETGVSIVLMDEGLDTGDIVLMRRVAIAPEETYGELHDRLAVMGAELLAEALDLAACGELPRRPQSGDAILTRPLAKDDYAIDLTWPADRIVNLVRSLSPKPAARANIGGENVKIVAAHVGERGELVIDRVIAPNRGEMSGSEYLRSRRPA